MRSDSERDEAAHLLADLHPKVYRALALYTGDRDAAEELTQEVMLRAWKHWRTVRGADSAQAWALRVGLNLANSRWRRLRLARNNLERTEMAFSDGVDAATVLTVRAAIRSLPERQRAAIVARYFFDMSVTDAAMAMNCAEGTVKALTSQAVTRLRADLNLDVGQGA